MTEHATRQPVILLRNLRKSFGTLEVLKGITFDAYKGDVIAILGSSGSGKSTMLRCINMLEIPTAGDVTVGEETVRLRTAPRWPCRSPTAARSMVSDPGRRWSSRASTSGPT